MERTRAVVQIVHDFRANLGPNLNFEDRGPALSSES